MAVLKTISLSSDGRSWKLAFLGGWLDFFAILAKMIVDVTFEV